MTLPRIVRVGWFWLVVGCGDNIGVNGPVVIDSAPAAITNQTHATFAFHVDGGDTAFTCQVDAMASVACSSPFAIDVTDGDHTFAVAAGDAPTTVAWRVDTIAPDTMFVTAPPTLDNVAVPTFAFVGSPASDVAGFQCALDSTAFAVCTSPIGVPVADGAHTFQVRAVDAAGNVDPTPAMHAWTVDTVAPTIMITAGPTGSIDTLQATFSFMASADAATVECSLDGQPFAGCVSPVTTSSLGQGAHTFVVRAKDLAGNAAVDDRGFTVDTFAPTVTITSGPSGPTNQASPTWKFTVGGNPVSTQCQLDTAAFATCATMFTATGLADGTHTFTVRATDAAGNIGSDSRTIVLDTSGPTVTITGGPSGPTNLVAPTFTFATTGAPSSILCRIDTAVLAACTTATSFVSPALLPGAHVFEVDVADAAGNQASATQAFTLDTSIPTVVITSGPSGATNVAAVVFTFTVAGGPTTIACRFDAAAFTSCAAGTFGATLPDGAHVFEVDVTDAAGNLGSATQAFTVDTIAPSVTITGGPTGATANPTPTFTFTTAGNPSVTQCRVDAGAFAACTSPITTSTLGGGAHVFEVQAIDAAGNVGDATQSFSVTSTAPAVSIITGPPNPTNVATATFTFTFGANATVVHCRVDAGAFVDCSAGTFTTAVLAEASHTFEVEACDPTNACANDTRTFVVDLTPPTVTILTGPSDPTPTNQAEPTFTFSTAGAPTTIQCRIRDAANPTPPFVACTTSFTPTAGLVDGQHTFEVQAIDAATNATSATRTFTVDTVSPGAMITGGPTGATNLQPLPTFTFTIFGGVAATVTCAFDAAAPVDCSGLAFPVPAAFADGSHEGTHTLAIKVTDAAGNSFTTLQSFVVDTFAPVVTISGPGTSPATDVANPAFTITTSPGGTQPITLRCQIDGGGFATCTSPFSPGSLADGAHTLAVLAEDPAHNVGTASHAFAIDTQRPTVTVIAPLIPARTSSPRPQVFFTTSDASPITVTCAIDSGAFAPCVSGFGATSDLSEAAHTYHIVALDDAGNPATTVDVPFVEDRTPPTIVITGHPVNPTNDATPSFAFAAGADAATVQCTMDTGQLISPCTSPVTFDAAHGGPLVPGDRTFTVTVADNAVPANSQSATFQFHLGTCGDGTAQGSEACDMADLRGLTCATDGFTAGTLACTSSCTLDTSGCTLCGNGVQEGSEQCDGSDLHGTTCATDGFDSGMLACTASCTFDTSGCQKCGNGVIEGSEQCDGGNLGGATCASEGFDGGTLACTSCTFDTSKCSSYVAANTGISGKPCFDGLRFGAKTVIGDPDNAFACTDSFGPFHSAIPASHDPTWTAATGVTNNSGVALAAHLMQPLQIIYAADPAGGTNYFTSANGGASFTAVTLTAPFNTQLITSTTIGIAAVGALLGTTNPVGGIATVLNGGMTLGARAVGTTVGTVTGSSAGGSNKDVYVAVNGSGGGIFRSCTLNSTGSAGTYDERDTGIAGSDGLDKTRVFVVTADPGSAVSTTTACNGSNVTTLTAKVLYAGLHGGGQLYKSADFGATWTQSNTGLPAGADVNALKIDCFSATFCHSSSVLFAATSQGLYKSTDAGAHWVLDGFEGLSVRAVAIHPTISPTLVYVGVDDAVGFYRSN